MKLSSLQTFWSLRLRTTLALCAAAALVACGGGGGAASTPASSGSASSGASQPQAVAIRAQPLATVSGATEACLGLQGTVPGCPQTGTVSDAGTLPNGNQGSLSGTADTPVRDRTPASGSDSPYTAAANAFPLSSAMVAFDLVNPPANVAKVNWMFTPQGGSASAPVSVVSQNGIPGALKKWFPTTGYWTATAQLQDTSGQTLMSLNQLVWVKANPEPLSVIKGVWQSRFVDGGQTSPWMAGTESIQDGVLKFRAASPSNYFWTVHVLDLGKELDASDIELQFDAKNSSSEGGFPAYDVGFSVVSDVEKGPPEAFRTGSVFMEPGMAGTWAGIWAGVESKVGLPSLGRDMSNWATYKLVRRNQVVTVYANGQEVESLTVTGDPGVMRYIQFSGLGRATFDNVTLKVHGVTVVDEKFGADPVAPMTPSFPESSAKAPVGATASPFDTLLSTGFMGLNDLEAAQPGTVNYAGVHTTYGANGIFEGRDWVANTTAPKFAARTNTNARWIMTDQGWRIVSQANSTGTYTLNADGSAKVMSNSMGGTGYRLVRTYTEDLSGKPYSAAGVNQSQLTGTFPAGAQAYHFRWYLPADEYRAEEPQGVYSRLEDLTTAGQLGWCGLSYSFPQAISTSGPVDFGSYGQGRYDVQSVNGERVLLISQVPAAAIAAATQQYLCASEVADGRSQLLYTEVNGSLFLGKKFAANSVTGVDDRPDFNLTAMNALLKTGGYCPFVQSGNTQVPGDCSAADARVVTSPDTLSAYVQVQVWVQGLWQDVKSIFWEVYDGVTVALADAKTIVQDLVAGGLNTLDMAFAPSGDWQVRATLRDGAGTSLGTVSRTLAVAPNPSPPSVSSVTPASVTAGELVMFTVTGSNLPASLNLNLAACTSISALTLDPVAQTQRQFHCQLSDTASGTLAGSVTVGSAPFAAHVQDFAVNASGVTMSLLPVAATGITDQQCYQAGSDTLVPCSSPAAIALSGAGKQDGMLGGTLSYSAVGGYSIEECVKDNATGLIWEGKTVSGLRAGSNRYTNYGDGRSGDTSEYVAAVNAQGLCGFNDWRLPTVDELQGIVDYSKPYPGPTVDAAWFPNTLADVTWTSSPYAGYASNAWFVSFGYGGVSNYGRSSNEAVRLVRASQ